MERGRSAYIETCAECHGATLRGGNHGPSLTGSYFARSWGNRAAGALHETIRSTMPPGGENTLSADSASDLVAYVLSSASVEPGAALPSEGAKLDALRICASP